MMLNRNWMKHKKDLQKNPTKLILKHLSEMKTRLNNLRNPSSQIPGLKQNITMVHEALSVTQLTTPPLLKGSSQLNREFIVVSSR